MSLKIGDIVWAYSEEQYCIQSYEIVSISDGWYDANATDIPNDECMDGVMFQESDIGMLVFLTREEAVQHHEFEMEDFYKDNMYEINEWLQRYSSQEA